MPLDINDFTSRDASLTSATPRRGARFSAYDLDPEENLHVSSDDGECEGATASALSTSFSTTPEAMCDEAPRISYMSSWNVAPIQLSADPITDGQSEPRSEGSAESVETTREASLDAGLNTSPTEFHADLEKDERKLPLQEEPAEDVEAGCEERSVSSVAVSEYGYRI
jgi:hypothetical protein